MKTFRGFFLAAAVLLVAASPALAADFDWLKDLNVMAVADPDGFKARLAARFKVGDAEITTVLSNVKRPEDAYMVFRLGEMSHHPFDRVVKEYKSGHGKGWGVMAKRLGIKPGSKEFFALKSGQNFDRDFDRPPKKLKGKDKKGKGGGPEKVKGPDRDKDWGPESGKGPDRDKDGGPERGKGPGRS